MTKVQMKFEEVKWFKCGGNSETGFATPLNKKEIIEIAKEVAKAFQDRIIFYFSNLKFSEEVRIPTKNVSLKENFSGHHFTKEVKLEIFLEFDEFDKRKKKPDIFVGYFDECGSFEEIMKVVLVK